MKDGAIQLGDIAGRITMLEVACRWCERHGRLSVAQLIERHGDMRLPELCLILPGDCPNAAAISISERCSVFFPQLRPEYAVIGTPVLLDLFDAARRRPTPATQMGR